MPAQNLHQTPERFFREQVENYGQQLAQVKNHIRKVAMLRVFSFLFTVLGIYLASGYSLLWVGGVAVPGFSVFGFFVYRHFRLFQEKQKTEKLLEINENELRLMQRDTSFQPTGLEFMDEGHPFAADLDIFGNRSLFQLLNRCATALGREKLAGMLLQPLQDKTRITIRQKAVAELSKQVKWRQGFQALDTGIEQGKNETKDLLRWAENSLVSFDKPVYRFLLVITPLLGFADVALISTGQLSYLSFLLFLLLPFAILAPRQEKINRAYDLLVRKAALLENYALLFGYLQQGDFESEIMQKALQKLADEKNSAQAAVKKLSAITKAFDYRLNMLTGFFLNTFFLWDILQSFRLEQWKKQYHTFLPEWFDTLAEVDALCSLAGFAFQHPEACYPDIRETGFIVRGNNLKHPFIDPAVCVGNPVNVEGWGRFQVITGANMAGKSTYLRTVGVNLLLAMTGAPVLADRFVFMPVQLFTGIKTSDSLQDGESYFFAELKRLKEIIVRLENGEKLFLILDEILRGTNSKDKQTGSWALLRQFIRLRASGLIATHDLALGELQMEFPENIENKRFEVEIEGEQMQFDYRLKEGVSQNLNATFLMKKMGITV